MAKNQNTFEKRRREFEKRQKSAAKLARKQERKQSRSTVSQTDVPSNAEDEQAI